MGSCPQDSFSYWSCTEPKMSLWQAQLPLLYTHSLPFHTELDMFHLLSASSVPSLTDLEQWAATCHSPKAVWSWHSLHQRNSQDGTKATRVVLTCKFQNTFQMTSSLVLSLGSFLRKSHKPDLHSLHSLCRVWVMWITSSIIPFAFQFGYFVSERPASGVCWTCLYRPLLHVYLLIGSFLGIFYDLMPPPTLQLFLLYNAKLFVLIFGLFFLDKVSFLAVLESTLIYRDLPASAS